MSAPHVLLLGSVLGQPFGGVRRHNAELLPRVARRLAEGGGSLSLLAGRAGVAFELPPEVEVIESRVPAGPPPWRALHEARELRRRLAERRRRGLPVDLLHTAHHPAPRGLRVPYTLTVHDLRALSSQASPWRRALAQPILARSIGGAARVITVSEAVKEELALKLAIDRARVAVVPNAADHFRPLPRERTANAPLLCLGHLERRKNVGLLLEALAIAPGLPDLCLAGAAKGAEEQRLRERARSLGVERRVHFLGTFEESELPRLLAGAAAVVLPSRLEGFSIGVLEAQRARVPLAISNIAPHREIAGATTPHFAVDDPTDCARAIRAALASTEEQLGAAAASSERYSWNASADRLVDAWRHGSCG